jgi:hypothetical protein
MFPEMGQRACRPDSLLRLLHSIEPTPAEATARRRTGRITLPRRQSYGSSHRAGHRAHTYVSWVGMITWRISLIPHLVDATALGQGHIQVIMPMHFAR